MAETMAAEDATVHYEDHEWESQRDTFTHHYMTEKKTLKDATRCMTELHNFHATPRQWERKIKAWGLEKYISRHERLKQIESQGISIHEVAQTGRRPKSYEPGLLHPEVSSGVSSGDTRNMRRFARRYINRSGSRSRSRSRSNSFGHRSLTASPLLGAEPGSEEVLHEEIYDLDFSPVLQSGAIHAPSNNMAIHVPAVPTDHDSFSAQAHVLQIQDHATGETSDELYLTLPNQRNTQDLIPDVDPLDQSHYEYATLDHRFSMDATAPPQDDHEPMSEFPRIDTTFENQTTFMSSQTVALEDISPTISVTHDRTWGSQSGFGSSRRLSTSSYLPDATSHPQSYHGTPTSDHGPTLNFQPASNAPEVATINVPQLVYPPPSPTPSPSMSHRRGSDTAGSSFPFHGPQYSPPSSTSDQPIYADFYAYVNRFSSSVLEAVTMSAYSPGDRADVLKALEDDVTLERSTFFKDMTMTLNNFVLAQQRAVQSLYKTCNSLKQQRNSLQEQKLAVENENAMLRQLLQQIPGAAEHMAHPHRMSLPRNYVFGGRPNMSMDMSTTFQPANLAMPADHV